MSVPENQLQSYLSPLLRGAAGGYGLYSGLQRGGVGGAQQALSGASGLLSNAGKLSGMDSLGQGAGYLGDAGNALGIYSGLQRGGLSGYASALGNAGKLYGNLSGSPTAGSYVGGLNNIMGIYNGLQRGGIQGYGGAAANTAQLAGRVLDNPALSSIGGYIAAPLSLYNTVENWQSGKTGSDAMNGAETGAAIGSIIPGVGTIVGGLVGGALGALSSAFGNGAKDPEDANFSGYIGAFNKNKNQGQQVANSIRDPYTTLAGLFDLRSNQIGGNIPIYKQYGRMGEERFVTDMAHQINQGLASGAIKKTDNPQTIMSKVVQPWINSFGKGQMNDPNSTAINDLLTSMVGQYATGQTSRWKDVNGGNPFSNLPGFGAAAPSSGVGVPSPSPIAAATPVAMARIREPLIGHAMMRQKHGGHVQHYDDGGSVDSGVLYDPLGASTYDYTNFDWLGNTPQTISGGGIGGNTDYYPGVSTYPTPDYGNFNWLNTPDVPTYNSSGTPTNIALPDNSGLYGWNPNQVTVQDPIFGSAGNYQYTPSPSGDSGSGGGSSGGILSGLSSILPGSIGNWWSGLNSGQQTGTLAALASLIGSAIGGPGAGNANMTALYNPAPPQMFQGSGPQATNAYGNFTTTPRQQTHPTGIDYAHYGQGPAVNFFTPSSSSPLASGAMMHNMMIQPGSGGAIMARGGQPGYSPLAVGDALSDRSRHVRGPGDGTSDDIDAKLSDGEYVIDANTVSMLGNGSNEAGARKLDEMRENLRKHAAKPMRNGRQFMKAKDPEKYMQEAAA